MSSVVQCGCVAHLHLVLLFRHHLLHRAEPLLKLIELRIPFRIRSLQRLHRTEQSVLRLDLRTDLRLLENEKTVPFVE